MTVRCFVDASVLLQARDARDPLKQGRAAEWLDRLWQQRSGRTSVQVLAEFYVMAIHSQVPGDLAWDDVSRYLAWSPQQTDEALLRRAREVERRYKLAWWDATVVAAAQMQDCLILLSDELPDAAVFGALAVRTPYGALLEEPAAEYAVARAAPLHRPRGRPRRATASSGRGPHGP
jgi:predicted nucleic acid-binding protein